MDLNMMQVIFQASTLFELPGHETSGPKASIPGLKTPRPHNPDAVNP